MAMTLLPSFFVMQSNSGGPYLGVVENPTANFPSGLLRFNQSQIWSPLAKFATEHSETGDGTLVHIRSCYNNKYWVANEVGSSLWIAASADKPEEDQTNPACTVFRASSSTSTGVQFFCISRSMYVYNIRLVAGGLSLSQGIIHGFRTVDWETLVILPSQVSFRSEDLDGNYLCSRVIDGGYNYHRFESGLDVGDPLVAHELFPTADGNYRIKNLHFGKFWRRSPNWIWADAEDNNNANDTLFSFVKISDKVVALRNLGNNNFCGGLTTEGKTDCLNAQYPSIARQARLVVEERVLNREISNVRYRLSDSRIYQEEIQEVSHAIATNDSVDKDATITLSYSSSDSRTTYWSNSLSLTLGVTLKFKAGAPLIAEGGIEVSTEIGNTWEWGEEQTTEHTREATYTAVVPPLTKIKVTLLCTKGACDVPFSYTQRDLLTNGQTVSTIKDDGIYTGINSYNFYFQSSNVVPDGQGRIYV